jgi:hypothetical protein
MMNTKSVLSVLGIVVPAAVPWLSCSVRPADRGGLPTPVALTASVPPPAYGRPCSLCAQITPIPAWTRAAAVRLTASCLSR